MTLVPFRVSFDGPLDRSERWRAGIAAFALGGAILFVVSGGLSSLLNASSDALAGWTNGNTEVVTTGTGSPDDRISDYPPSRSLLKANAAVQAEATIASKPKPRLRSSDIAAPATSRQHRQSQQIRSAREPVRSHDDAATELRWRQRAAEIERRSRNEVFR
ncbi:MAG: hypothetical protein ACO1NY_08950 [Pseudorhodoplanes sp.]